MVQDIKSQRLLLSHCPCTPRLSPCTFPVTVKESIQNNRDNTLSKLTDYRPNHRRMIPGKGLNFFSTRSFRPALGPTRSCLQWESVALSSEVNQSKRDSEHVLLIERLTLHGNFKVTTPIRLRPERETEHSPPSSTEVKNVISLPGTRQIYYTEDNFNFINRCATLCYSDSTLCLPH